MVSADLEHAGLNILFCLEKRKTKKEGKKIFWNVFKQRC